MHNLFYKTVKQFRQWVRFLPVLPALLIFSAANAQLSGTYTVGSSGNYSTLTAAVAALNTNGVNGPVTFLLTDNTYSSSETFPITINQITGANASRRITIRPAANVNAVITGSSTNAIIRLNGADFITLDGANTRGGSTRNLSVVNTNTAAATAAIWVSSAGTGQGAVQDSIKNLNISAGSNSATGTTGTSNFGIYVAGTTITATGTGADNDSLTIHNNHITRAYNGIYARGVASTGILDGLVITQNIIGHDSVANYVTFRGVDVQNANLALIRRNTIFNLRFTVGTNNAAIDLGANVTNATVSRNFISGVTSQGTTGWGAYGINISATSTSNIMIVNNMISDILTINYTTTGTIYNAYGIRITGGTNHKVYYNSVNLFGTPTVGTGGGIPAALVVTAGTGMDIRNNALSNSITGTSSARNYAIHLAATTSIGTINHNNYFVDGPNGVLGRIGTTEYSTLTAWRQATSQDANSISVNPMFTSNTDLHSSSPSMNGAATPISGITEDFDGQTRDLTNPDIGADEFTPAAVDAGITQLVSPAAGSCAGLHNVTVRLRNFGLNRLDSVRIVYFLDGVQQSSQRYYPNLASANNLDITLGTITLSNTPQTIRVYTTDPNGIGTTDPNPGNDTIVQVVGASLTGTYTIGGAGADFSNFTSAVNALATRGVCGAVTFNVADSIYHEKIMIPEITGASSTNTIVFQSASGDSSRVVLIDSSSASATDNYVLWLNGADFVTFRGMTFSRPGTLANARVIEISGAATNNSFLNNRILGGTSTATSNTLRANIHSNSDLDNNNVFRNNRIMYGSYGFYYRGTSATVNETGSIIEDNIIDSVQHRGIDIQFQDSTIIRRNKILVTVASTGYGIYMLNCNNTLIVRENQVIMNSGYGIYPSSCTGTATERGLIANNMVSLGGTALSYGIYLLSSSYQDVVYNNVLSYSTNTASNRTFYVTGSTTNNRAFNNNFINLGGGVAYELNAAAVTANNITESNYNNLFAVGSTLGVWGATSATDIAGWRTASNRDANSISVNPRFRSNEDLHVRAAALDGAATPFPGVSIDFDGEPRDATTPDIGADEFTVYNNDLRVAAILSPTENTCGDTATMVRAVIVNEGQNSQSNFSVTANISGPVTQTLNYNYTGTLASEARDTITFPGTFNSFAGGNFTISVHTNLSTDQNRINDTARVSVRIFGIPSSPTVTDVVSCDPVSVQLTATTGAGLNLQWFTSDTAPTPVFTGDTFSTPVLTTSTTYFVAATQQTPARVGPVDNTMGTTGNFANLTAQNLHFEVYAPMTIDSFAVYANAAGDVYVRLLSGTGVPLDTVIRSVGTPGVKTMIPVGLTLEPGAYRLDGGGSTTGGLQRNSAGAAYPYEVPGVMAITGSSFNVNSYYYFYDWHISTAGCPSPRVPVRVSVGERPQGVTLMPSALFNGTFNEGTANNPDSVCAGSTVVYDITPPTGSTNSDAGTRWAVTSYSVMTMNGTPAMDTSFTGATDTSNAMIVFTPVVASADSTYMISVNVRNLLTGCDTVINRRIHVSPNPAADFTADNVCLGNPMFFNNTSTGLAAGASFRYYFGDGTMADSANAIHTYADTGTYTVSLVIVNNTGCRDSISRQVQVFPNPVANFVVADADVCHGQAVQFNDSSSIPAGVIADRLWRFGDGSTSTATNPAHVYDSTGTYTVTLIVSSANGCMDSTTQVVNIYPQPVAGFTAPNVCDGEEVTFTNTSTIQDGNLVYLWNFGNGDTSSAMNPTHRFAQAGTYRVSLTVVSPNQCLDTFSQNITVYELPDAGFTSNTISGRTLSFTPDQSGLTNYLWNFGDGDASTAQNPTHTYTTDGTYLVTLRVTNSNGCVQEFSDSVNVTGVGIAANVKADVQLNIFPNPFREQTNIVYELEKTARVRVSVYDMSGKEVAVLADANQTPGKFTYVVDAETHKLNTGIYLVRILVDDALITKQIIRMK